MTTSTCFLGLGSLALLVACLLIGGATAGPDLTGQYTEGDFSASSSNSTHCKIFGNYRFKGSQPHRFSCGIEVCTGTPRDKSMTLCEVKVASAAAACASDYTFRVEDSCYRMILEWRAHDYAAALCEHYGYSLAYIADDDASLISTIGGLIVLNGGAACGNTAEFTLGNTAVPAYTAP